MLHAGKHLDLAIMPRALNNNNNNNNNIYFYSANSTVQFSNALYNVKIIS